jgi:tetratricopeptide (TPR) repeat protein
MNKSMLVLLILLLAGCGESERNKTLSNNSHESITPPPQVTSINKTKELVSVKYQGVVDVSNMQCQTITRSSYINRLCYDADEEYVVVLLDNTYYHHCAVPENVVSSWLEADSMGRYYRNNVMGNFDCRLSTPPTYAFNSTSTIASSAPQQSIIIDSAKTISETTSIPPTSNTSDQLPQPPLPSSSFNSRSLNAEGLRLSVQGNIEQALLAFEQAAQLNPNDSEILGNLAYSHYQLGHYQPAEQVLYRALSIKPKRGSSWLLVGQLRSVRGDLNGAVEALDKYLYFSSRKNAAVEQLNDWANGYGDGANFPALRQAAAQSLANAGYR